MSGATSTANVAERRVRLGLLIGEIGEKNKVEVTQDELRQALLQEAQQYPGQAKEVYEYLREDAGCDCTTQSADFRRQGH